jgi:urease accessory protein
MMPAEDPLIRLMSWMSPAFPTGGFSYSHGLEYAVEAELVVDRKTLTDWVDDVIRYGSGRMDAVYLAHAWRAVDAGDDDRLLSVVEAAHARRATAETALESTQQGVAFLDAVQAGWPDARLDAIRAAMERAGGTPVLSVAVGIAAALARIPLAPAAIGYLHAFAANLISAGVRLVPLGQRDGLRALAAQETTITAIAAYASEQMAADVGSCNWMVDWLSMRHETQRTRLFRS